jgi:transketolase
MNAMEQIKVDLAYSSRHVVLCAQSPAVAYGELGPMHPSWSRLPDGTPRLVRPFGTEHPGWSRPPGRNTPNVTEHPG